MKKIFLTLLSISLFSAATSAQMRFGIKGGLNLANISVSPAQSNPPKSIIGFHGGVVLDAALTDKISIQPNLLFSLKGASGSVSIGTGTIESKATLNYIEVPVNFVYSVTDAFTVGAGPYLGYALSGNSAVTSTISGFSSYNESLDFEKEKIKRLDFGLNFTAGYEVTEGIVISANYSLGLANISDDANVTSKNNVIGFSVTKFFGEK